MKDSKVPPAKVKTFKPDLFVKEGGILALSGPGLQELLQAVVAKGASFRFQARGFSMSPFIQDGDNITVSPLNENLPALGEVMAFVHPESQRLVVHRIIDRRDQRWHFRGDNAPLGDGLIPQQRILGRVTKVERQGKIVRGGLGLERIPIALLSRRGWLPQALRPIYFVKHIVRLNLHLINKGWANG